VTSRDSQTPETELGALKRRLRAKYLGHHGIHGIGVSEDESAVYVYIEYGGDRAELCRQLEMEVAPHRLIVIEAERPTLS